MKLSRENADQRHMKDVMLSKQPQPLECSGRRLCKGDHRSIGALLSQLQ